MALSDALKSNDLNTLIQLFKDNPTWDTVHNTSIALHHLSFEDPSKIDGYTTTLAALQKSPHAPDIISERDGKEELHAFEDVFQRQMYNIITALFGDVKVISITPTNNYLIASILSGSAIRNGLCVSSAQIGEVTQGLQFTESEYKDHAKPKQYEVYAVGACIQVLAAGQAILKTNMLLESEFKERIMAIGRVAKSHVGKVIIQACCVCSIQDKLSADYIT
jgi:hypothetical protein